MKNLLEGGILGSISMKEVSSYASRVDLKELSRLSNDGFRFTNQLYEKLSIERGCEISMVAALLGKIFKFERTKEGERR